MTNHIDKKNHWQKDFNGWNSRKQKLNARKLSLNFKERDIWYMSVGTNIGSETDGKNYKYERPVLVMRKFSQNTFLGAPLTSKKRIGNYYAEILHDNKISHALLNQVRVFDARRLSRQIYQMDSAQFRALIEKFKALL